MVGTLAAILTSLAYLPQAIKIWRSGSTDDISLAMFLAMCAGTTLWLAYGAMLQAWPIIFANVTALILTTSILVMKIRSIVGQTTRRPKKVPAPPHP